jgi:flagellar hook-basal body complex protein FliE
MTMDPLLNLNSIASALPAAAQPEVPTQGQNFADLLQSALQEVNQAQHSAEQEARNLMGGEATDIHSAILAVQKADVSFQMMMAVRSKLIEAYREVMRMQM